MRRDPDFLLSNCDKAARRQHRSSHWIRRNLIIAATCALLMNCANATSLQRCTALEGEAYCLAAAGEAHRRCRMGEVHEALRLGCLQAPGGSACAYYQLGDGQDWDVCPLTMRGRPSGEPKASPEVGARDEAAIRITLHNAGMPPDGFLITRVQHRYSQQTFEYLRDSVGVTMVDDSRVRRIWIGLERSEGRWTVSRSVYTCPKLQFDPERVTFEECMAFTRASLWLEAPNGHEVCRITRDLEGPPEAEWLVTFCASDFGEVDQWLRLGSPTTVLKQVVRPGSRL